MLVDAYLCEVRRILGPRVLVLLDEAHSCEAQQDGVHCSNRNEEQEQHEVLQVLVLALHGEVLQVLELEPHDEVQGSDLDCLLDER